MYGAKIDEHDAQGDVVAMILVFQKMLELKLGGTNAFVAGDYETITAAEQKEIEKALKAKIKAEKALEKKNKLIGD